METKPSSLPPKCSATAIVSEASGRIFRSDHNCCRATLNKIRNKEVYKQELKDIEIKANFVPDYKRDTKGDKNGRSKLTEQQVLEIIDLLLAKEKSQAEIARLYSISTSTINNIKKKRTWTHLTQGVEFD